MEDSHNAQRIWGRAGLMQSSAELLDRMSGSFSKGYRKVKMALIGMQTHRDRKAGALPQGGVSESCLEIFFLNVLQKSAILDFLFLNHGQLCRLFVRLKPLHYI
jgi:hypothetical protein